MIEISNRHFDIIIDKLPRVLNDLLQKSRTSPLTLRQTEDIRQLQLMCQQLKKKFNNK